MLYQILKLALTISIRLFYSEIKVLNKPALKKGEGKILISNHPNTLMDAFLIAMQLSEPIHFMAKGTYFNSKFKLWLLSKFKMIPVQRKQDPENKYIDNKDALKYVKELLAEGKSIIIFPEGNSFPERKLRPVKPGTAKIALEAVSEYYEACKELKIYPIAIKYVNQSQFRSKVLLEFDTPIDPKLYLEAYAHDSRGAIEDLTLKVSWSLRQKLLPIEDNEYDEEIKLYEKHLPYLTQELKDIKRWNVLDLISFTETIIAKDDELSEHQVEREALKEKLQKLDRYVSKLGLKASQWQAVIYAPGLGVLMLKMLWYLLVFPFYLVGMATNLIPFATVRLLTRKITHEVEYYSAINVVLSALLFPMYYSLFIYLMTLFGIHFHWYLVLAYFPLFMFLGVFTYYVHNGLLKTFKSFYWIGAHYSKRELIQKVYKLRLECKQDLMRYLKSKQ